jgi:hypothetical protein
MYNDKGHIIVKEGMSIQDAIDAADKFDTVKVMPGNYEENIKIQKPVNLKGSGSEESVIKPDTGRVISIGSQVAENGYIKNLTVQDFTLRSGDDSIVLQSDSATDGKYNARNYIYKNLVVDANNNNETAIGLFDAKNITLNNVQVQNCNRSDGAALEMVGVKNLKVYNSKFENNRLAVKIFSVDGYQNNGNINISNTEFRNNRKDIINEENNLKINATHNYWGQSSGPADSDISGNVDYRPWLLEENGDKYDFTVAFDKGWNLISAPTNVNEYEIYKSEDIVEGWLSHDESGWISSSEDVRNEFKNPANAVFVKTKEPIGVGYNWTKDTNPEDTFANKQLSEGWNLVSTGITGDYKDQMSHLKYESGEGLASIFAPNTYNENKDLSYNWQNPQMDTTTWNDGDKMYRLDGYWVYISGSDEDHKVPVEPVDSVSGLMKQAGE